MLGESLKTTQVFGRHKCTYLTSNKQMYYILDIFINSNLLQKFMQKVILQKLN